MLRHQFRVRAALDDAPAIDDDDHVRLDDRGEAVRDDERGPAVQDGAQRFLDDLLRLRIHAARRLVEDDDARVRQDDAGEGDQLPLPDAQAAAALADLCLVPFGQSGDEVVDADRARRRLHLRIRCVQFAVADILGDRRGEEEGILQDDAELAAQRVQRHLAHIVAVDQRRGRPRYRRSAARG